MSYSIVYGKDKIFFDIPKNFSIFSIKQNFFSGIKNVYNKTQNSLMNPINSESLSSLIKGKESVCIVVTDITRMCPDEQLLIPILEILEKEISHKKITILIASGMHKKMTDDEKIEKYGKTIFKKYKIIDHNANDKKNLVTLGKTKSGNIVKLSKPAITSDFLISLGVVEPHQFAGYSGGYKTVSIGIADDATISRTHSGDIFKKTKITVGQIEDNPIYEEIIEIGKKSGLKFIVNVIMGNSDEILDIQSGEPFETHRMLIKKIKQFNEISLKKSFDVVICGVGYPKDSNLYQATRAASYLFFAKKPIINPGGYIIIPAPCLEGAGRGIGEKRFFSMLKNHDIDEILNIDRPFQAGEQRSYFVANVLKECKIIIVGSKFPEIVKDAKMIPAENMDTAFELIQKDLEDAEVLLIPNALSAIPKIQ